MDWDAQRDYGGSNLDDIERGQTLACIKMNYVAGPCSVWLQGRFALSNADHDADKEGSGYNKQYHAET